MNYNFNEIYNYFDSVKSKVEYAEYIHELQQINQLLNTIPFDNYSANKLCSELSTKYKAEINKMHSKSQSNIVVVQSNQLKSDMDIINDLNYFKSHIPVFAVERTVKSELQKQILGLI